MEHRCVEIESRRKTLFFLFKGSWRHAFDILTSISIVTNTALIAIQSSVRKYFSSYSDMEYVLIFVVAEVRFSTKFRSIRFEDKFVSARSPGATFHHRFRGSRHARRSSSWQNENHFRVERSSQARSKIDFALKKRIFSVCFLAARTSKSRSPIESQSTSR